MIYDSSETFLEVYPNYDLDKLPSWIRENINVARVYGTQKKGVILPDGRKYHLDNQLNDLSGREWTYFINSVFSTRYSTNGKDSFAHHIRKIHPTPKPPQLMRDLISFFTKENDLVFDAFMGVGGTLLGAALCGRKGAGIDINQEYVETYKKAAAELNLPEFDTVCADSLQYLQDPILVEKLTKGFPISLFLIDPPYANMMSKAKTGADISIYGKTATPFSKLSSDLGNMERSQFLQALKKAVELVLPYIKFRGYILLFIKDLQPHKKNTNLLHSEVINSINEIPNVFYKGLKIWVDETTKLYPYGYPFSFVSNQIHQYILVFRKEK